ncbi:hypothetical protein CYMTET_14881 [Cymbomonas tetramitiformis]|uniref:Cyclic nucleotide-binding domain-containing protein n=1 Tax=Cymbomonas tetramitiformis TaxID=36881 RepID=A0AAE0GF59_9CHLO|nr:hypothetical protein CYMTET_14881 [Cymbomonas tetramitiformis]
MEGVEEAPAKPPPLVKNKSRSRRRASVSAECCMPVPAELREKKVVPKDEASKERVKASLKDSIIFGSLDEEQCHEVIDAVEEKSYAPGETIINQGEEGDFFFIVDQGSAQAFLKSGDEEPVLVKSYKHGDTFGELALLYNAPRAATVKAETECVTWAMDRATFRAIVVESTQRTRQLHEQFLEDVPLLSSLTRDERCALADVLSPEYFEEGAEIIKQGDEGTKFFILESGEVEAKANGMSVMKYSRGDYFGELALLNNEPRKADCIAQTRCKLISVDRVSFKRMLGKLEGILKRNMEEYVGYVGQGLVSEGAADEIDPEIEELNDLHD